MSNQKEHVKQLIKNTPIEVKTAYKPTDEEIEKLNNECETTPAGGWRALAGLASGSFLHPTKEKFEFKRAAEKLSNTEVKIRLAEGFTKHLCPPGVASGLFVTLGLHPAWGVHLKHRLIQGQKASKDIFSDEIFEDVANCVKESLEGILEIVQKREELSFTQLNNKVEYITRKNNKKYKKDKNYRNEIKPFVPASSNQNWTNEKFTKKDLINGWLKPCGILKKAEEEMLTFDNELANQVEIFNIYG